jgi:hypothetical protein
MTNNPAQTDPAGGLAIGIIGVAWGVAVFMFHGRLFPSKRVRSIRLRKWGKVFFLTATGAIFLGSFLMAVENAWILLTHR